MIDEYDREDVVREIREAARRLHVGTATYDGPTDLSCQAVWGAWDNFTGDYTGSDELRLTDQYGKLFCPRESLIGDDWEEKYFKEYWLKASPMYGTELREWRVTALCLYAAMIEAGDVEGL